jgi:predicted acyltransferase
MLWPTDPEGLFTTISAVFNTYAGLMFCLLMKSVKDTSNKNTLLFKWLLLSFSLATLGLYISYWEYPNKKIWTIPFAFITSAFTGLFLCFLYFLIDVLNFPLLKNYLIRPFVWLGMNPLAVFVGMDCIEIILMRNITFYYAPLAAKTSVWNWIFI